MSLVAPESFLLKLFQAMRKGGLGLTLDQHDLLRQAVSQGYGLKGWDDLRQLCQILWVKPSPNYDHRLFNQAFAQFQEDYAWQRPEPKSTAPLTEPPRLGVLPQVPTRKRRVRPEQSSQTEVPAAVKTGDLPPASSVSKTTKKFVLRDLPVDIHEFRVAWHLLRQWAHLGHETELDVEATLRQIQDVGLFSELVFRPVPVRRADLLLLVDESNAMVPFQPVLKPLITAVEQHWIIPAQVYRFTVFPDDYLYPWKQPIRGVPLSQLLPKFHPTHTIVLIWSDAEAATGGHSPDYNVGMTTFLQRLAPCVRQILWLNPLPKNRWQHTSAQMIATQLKGQMYSLSPGSLRTMTRQLPPELMLQR